MVDEATGVETPDHADQLPVELATGVLLEALFHWDQASAELATGVLLDGSFQFDQVVEELATGVLEVFEPSHALHEVVLVGSVGLEEVVEDQLSQSPQVDDAL